MPAEMFFKYTTPTTANKAEPKITMEPRNSKRMANHRLLEMLG